MASISDGKPTKWGEIGISGRGLQAEVEWGPAASVRSGGPAVDPLSAQLAATDGLELVAEAQVRQLELTGTGGRGAPADGAVVVDLGEPVSTERRVVLVQEGDRFAWFIPESEARSVELPVEAAPGSRGWAGDLVHRVVRVVAVKAFGGIVKHVSGTLVGAWDERAHPYEIRTWTPENYQAADPTPIDSKAFSAGPALLIIHGFLGAIHNTFASFAQDVVRDLNAAYGDRVFAFNHQTLVPDPVQNVDWFFANLPKNAKLEVDIMAHSRGGLVAREIARRVTEKEPRIKVRSITFVATPNDGTPFADPKRPEGLLDAVTNLIGAIPGSAPLEFALELLKDIVLKNALSALGGLWAMQHGGEYLKELNGAALDEDLVLRSISADFEPRTDAGIVTTARNRLTDLYFGGVRNDMVVPTLSTFLSEAVFHIPPERRLVLDSSRGVNHSTFWSDLRAVKQLRDWLRADAIEHPAPPVNADESDPGAETALPPDPVSLGKLVEAVKQLPAEALKTVENLVGGSIDAGALAPGEKTRDAVIVVPGIMGSHLRTVADKRLIWLDPMRLASGHFRDLRMGPGEIEMEPAGLNRSYLPLVTKLAASWDVYLADYDWRADIRTSARRLAALIKEWDLLTDTKRGIHFVAHSMGGLVCRTLELVEPDTWHEIRSDTRRGLNGAGSGRLVMLGTPNLGSFTIPLTLTGDEMILKALAVVDVKSSREDLIGTVATFPGVYQMLPSVKAAPDDDDHAQLFKAASWGPGTQVQQALLDDAATLQEELSELHDFDRFIYVAGYGHPTPFRLKFPAAGSFTLGRFTQGDQRVPWKLGLLSADVPTFYSSAVHGRLPGDPAVLAAIDDLLLSGSTSKLLDSAPEYRGAGDPERPVMVAAAQWDPDPTIGLTRGGSPSVQDWRSASRVLEDALGVTIGGGVGRPPVPRLRIRVVHGGLEFSSHPVAIGHYAGLSAGGAEGALDFHLGGALRERQALGLYPDDAGSAMVVPGRAGCRIEAGIVLGLGNYGKVTQSVLSQAMKTAVLSLIVDGGRQPDGTRTAPTGISSVLIGVPGRHGFSLASSLRSQVEGVIRALIEVGRTGSRVDDFEIEFIECYEYRAESAVQAVQDLRQVIDPGLLDDVELDVVNRLVMRGGARPGAPPADESGEQWVRIEVKLDDDKEAGAGSDGPIKTVQFIPLTRGAQANLLKYQFDLDKVDRFVDAAIRRASTGEDVTHALYEMLFPNRSKLELDPSESLHLLLDETMAQLPWELLAARARSGESTPLSLRAGLLRQLVSDEQTRERSEAPVGTQALVIGNPPTHYAPLPAARAEAEAVSRRLSDHKWTVTSRIYGDDHSGDAVWMEILNALHANPYRVIHVAAHGVFDGEGDHLRSGVIIGPEDHQRITALDFQQMSVTPDLVFLNCCHLGRLGSAFDIEEQAPPLPDDLMKPHRVAGTVARQLLLNGVSAVIVAGWAVDDAAASAFATCVYDCLLGGVPFGEAVRRARQAAKIADGGASETWGAYQCYGDPGFQLVVETPPGGGANLPASSGQLVRRLSELAARAGDAFDRARLDIATEIDELRAAVPDLFDDPGALAALGAVYGELGDYRSATQSYRAAVDHPKGGATLRAAEQLVNLQVRQAVEQARATGGASGRGARRVAPEIDELFDKAIEVLDKVVALGTESAEREAIRGSLHKKRATLDSGRRSKELDAARAAYERAHELSSDTAPKLNPYHTNLWLQMTALAAGGPARSADQKVLHDLLEQVGKDAKSSTDYWDVAALADTLVTAAVMRYPGDDAFVALLGQYGGTGIDHRTARQAEKVLDVATNQYVEAFRLNSTVRQRSSSADHIDDLIELTTSRSLRKALEEMRARLNRATRDVATPA